jgi:hypothetical protein
MTHGTTKSGIDWEWTLDDGELGEVWLTVEDNELGRSYDELLCELRIPHETAWQLPMNGNAPLGAQGPPSLRRYGDLPTQLRKFEGESAVVLFLTLFRFSEPPLPLREAIAKLEIVDDPDALLVTESA